MRYALIAVGGALGALARWRLSLWLDPGAAFPVAILAINLSGAFVLGWLVRFAESGGIGPDLRLGLVTGFLGAYTTFSTWEAGVFALAGGGRGLLALGYLAASLVGGLACAAAGMAVAGQRLRIALGGVRDGVRGA